MPKARRKYVDELMDELEELKEQKASPSKLKNIIDKIGNLADKKAVSLLLEFIDHERDYIRATTIQALLKIRYKHLPELIMERMDEEQSMLVKVAMLEALGESENESCLPLLQETVQDYHAPDKIKVNAIFAIDRLTRGRIPALEMLVDYLIDAKNPKTRVEAAKALGKLGDPRAKRFLIAQLDDDKIFVRKFIIKALVSFGDKSVVDPIINAFTDENHFLDRDFIKVLWIFPEYKGKELWEIIEMRKRERLEELQVPESGLDDSIEEKSMVRDAFQYELAVNEGKCKIPGSEPVPAKPGKEPRVQPRDCDDETVMLEESKARAKQEMVPGSREKEIQMIKRDLLHEFSKFFNKGERAYRKKLYYEAVMNFKKALEIKYDAWQAWYNMALVFYDIEEPEKSMECFKKSLEFKPNEVDTLINIASLYRENGKYHAAIKFFLRALELDKYQTDVWLVLGKIFKKLKIFKFSLYCLDQVLKLSKNKKERKETRKMYEIMVEAHPEVKPTDPLEEEMPRMPEEDLKLKLD